MKKIIAICMIMLCLFSIAGCEREVERYRHEYIGVVRMKARRQTGRMIRVIYYVDCDNVIFNDYEGDEEFEMFLMQNLGRKVKLTVDVLSVEDHEASYGNFEIIKYEIIK